MEENTDLNTFPVTVETLADWYAQTINRSFRSVVNPKKSYYCHV